MSTPVFKKRLAIAFVSAIVFVGLVYAALTLAGLYAEQNISDDIARLNLPLILALSIALFLTSAVAWRKCLLLFEDQHLSLRGALSHIGFMLVAKYTPGKVWGIVARAATADRYSIRADSIVRASLLEVLISSVCATLLGAVLYASQYGYQVATLTAVLALVTLAIVNRVITGVNMSPLFKKYLARLATIRQAGNRDLLLMEFLFTFQWLFIGVVVALIAIATAGPFTAGEVAAVAGAAMLSVVAGFIAVFATGGIGVREGSLVLLLAPVMPLASAIEIALFLRLWTSAYDLLCAGIGYLAYIRAPIGQLEP